MRDLASAPEHFGLNTATLRQWDLERIIDACASRGIGAIAPWHEDVERMGVQAVRRMLDDAGLALCGYCRGGLFPALTAESRTEVMNRNRHILDVAKELDAPCVALVAGGLPGLHDGVAPSRDIGDARNQVRDGIAQLLKHAKEIGMPLAIEPLHPMYAADRACVNTLAHALDICEELDPDGDGALGVAVDCYHVWWDPDLEQQIARAGRKRLMGFHVCDWLVPTRDMLNDRGMMGDGVIDIPKIRGWVERTGFDGFVEVEIFSRDNWWKRDGEEVLDVCMDRFETVV
jgi:sugar phosphate isomerase/epimerase